MKGYKMYSKRKREKVLEKVREELKEAGIDSLKDEILQECKDSNNDVIGDNVPVIMEGTSVHITGIGENFIDDKVIIKLDIEMTLDALKALILIGEEFQ